MLENEKQLVERAAKRDRRAFAKLYSLYVNKIYNYIYYKSSSKAEAEDLTAHVFLKAWEAIDNYRWQGYPFSTWLYRIAHNQIVDHYRTRREVMPLDLCVEAAEPSLDPLELAERAVLIAQVRSALGHLTNNQQRVVVLRYFEGYSISEIATMMGKAPDAIRALQHRALQVLQPRIREIRQPQPVRQPQPHSTRSINAN